MKVAMVVESRDELVTAFHKNEREIQVVLGCIKAQLRLDARSL